MATVYINNQPVDIGNEKLNLIQAAFKIGVFIPYYCWHPALTVVASCRMCLVEIGERKPDGSTVMQPRVARSGKGRPARSGFYSPPRESGSEEYGIWLRTAEESLSAATIL